ncbi:hypothetical protein [Saccharopolyspora sp. NPDC002376]
MNGRKSSRRVSVPVYLRAGDGPEHHIGNVEADPLASRESVAAYLRAVADEIERTETQQ